MKQGKKGFASLAVLGGVLGVVLIVVVVMLIKGGGQFPQTGGSDATDTDSREKLECTAEIGQKVFGDAQIKLATCNYVGECGFFDKVSQSIVPLGIFADEGVLKLFDENDRFLKSKRFDATILNFDQVTLSVCSDTNVAKLKLFNEDGNLADTFEQEVR